MYDLGPEAEFLTPDDPGVELLKFFLLYYPAEHVYNHVWHERDIGSLHARMWHMVLCVEQGT